MVALRVPEMCFWSAKSRKSLNFLRCIHVIGLVLNYGSDINEGNWLQLLFYFIALLGIVASIIGMSFFIAVFQVLDWNFLVLHINGSVCNWIPKVIWPRLCHFWRFLWDFASFRRLHICMDWNLHEVLNCYFFDDINFFRWLFWGLFWSVL